MSGLNALKVYGSDSESSGSEEDFLGFCTEETSYMFQPVSRSAEMLLEHTFTVGCRDDSEIVVQSEGEPSGESSCESPDSEGSFTASDSKKKRRSKKAIQRAIVAKKRRLSHPMMLEGCNCSRNCTGAVAKDDRIAIHHDYWKMNAGSQIAFVRERVNRIAVQKRSINRHDENPRKTHTYEFTLQIANQEVIRVCRKFFLNTIGYAESCGNIVYRCLEDNENGRPKSSMRGKYTRNTYQRDMVQAHIRSFNPTISHYRREHAPNRLYLPSDLTEVAMHKHFQLSHPEINVSYAFYCRIVKKMNIVFVKLGNEQCEQCIASMQHRDAVGHNENCTTSINCTVCEKQNEHLAVSKITRAIYREDAEGVVPNQIVLAVDLQKVIQLPRLEGLKTVVFSQRLIAFNETFAPVGDYAKIHPVVACLWNEAVSGRSSNNITSCFHRVILRFSNMSIITLWLDNCSSQNKNWSFFLHLLILINSKAVNSQKIVLKYFEPGHTFMAADSFHAAVEKSMRKKPTTSYPEFKLAVSNAKRNVDVFDMTPNDFFQTPFSISQYTLNKCKPRPYIDNIRKVEIRKGDWKLYYSSSVNEAEGVQCCSLLSSRLLKEVTKDEFCYESALKRSNNPVGIEAVRKEALLNVVLPLIAEDQKSFWNDLPVAEE